jgi:hypothetical protein
MPEAPAPQCGFSGVLAWNFCEFSHLYGFADGPAACIFSFVLFALLASADGEPGRRPEIIVPGGVIASFQYTVGDVTEREVGHRVAARLVQQHHVLAVGDTVTALPDAHPPAQRFGKQQPLRQRLRDEKLADRSWCERSLLPRQPHGSLPFLCTRTDLL